MKESMRTRISNFLIYIIQVLHHVNRVLNKHNDQDKITPLTPCIIKEDNNVYLNKIKSVLENVNIKNIAITGIYGSGKSSILKTFQSAHKEYSYLNISLASFKDYEKAGGKETHDNLIEASILQQMFYHVKDEIIPDSRFKRIKHQSTFNLFFKSLFLFFWLISAYVLFKLKIWREIGLCDFPFYKKLVLSNIVFFDFVFLFLFSWGIVSFTMFILRICNNARFSKLNFKNVEIEISKNTDSSVLNKHLDEILYFFEVTRFDVVIIEDLDRFKNSDIFTKLREINILINNSEQINRRVVFIYAIKDDMFKNDDRIKFFDFIIPVIPIITSSNSEEILIKMLMKNEPKHSLKKEFISDISLYISDMRMLINIINEFVIYKNNLNSLTLDFNKLFAMIVYKNKYPADFAKLHNNNGLVYSTFNSKKKIIADLIKDKNKKISEIEGNIAAANNSVLQNTSELRAVYIQALIEKLPNPAISILIDNNEYILKNLRTDDVFDKLIKLNKIDFFHLIPGYNNEKRKASSGFAFKDVENQVDTKNTYMKRLELINLNHQNKLEQLKTERDKLTDEINFIKHLAFRNLIKTLEDIDVFGQDMKEERLLVFLIRNGYIDELYQSYISHFYEGNITRLDMDFVLSVKNKNALNFDYRLSNASVVVGKIWKNEYDQKEVLNLDLLDFLLGKETEFQTELKSIFKQLSNESESSIKFINDYIYNGKQIEFFMKHLCNTWSRLCKYLIEESKYPTNKIKEYLEQIVFYADIKDFESLNENEILSNYISAQDDFLFIASNDIHRQKLKNVIDEIPIVFINLKDPNETKELFDFVYEKSYYEINEQMIELIINNLNTNEQCNSSELKKANYTTIIKSDCKELKDYINNNINQYISNVFLKIETNNEESENIIIQLMNNTNITNKNKNAILEKEKKTITDIMSINDRALWSKIIELCRLEINWPNLIHYYEAIKELDAGLLNILNSKTYSKKLSETTFSAEQGFSEEVTEEFSIKLLLAENITNDCYSNIITSTPYTWNELDIQKLSREKVKIMLELKKLSLTSENFKLLQQYFNGEHLSLLMLDFQEYLANFTNYPCVYDDFNKLLRAKDISIQQKKELIEKIDIKILDGQNVLLDTIGEILLEARSQVKYDLFMKIVKDGQDIVLKVKLLLPQLSSLDTKQITNILYQIGGKYSDIADGKRPIIESTQWNKSLILELQKKNYISSFKDAKGGIRVNTKRKS